LPLSLGFWLVRGSTLGPICGLSARQLNSCLPRRKEDRCNNLILYRVPESGEDRGEERNKDREFCLQLFNNVLQAGIDDNDSLHSFRLGRWNGWPCIQFNCSSCVEQFANGSAVF